jgi:hypothetical protein
MVFREESGGEGAHGAKAGRQECEQSLPQGVALTRQGDAAGNNEREGRGGGREGGRRGPEGPTA